MNNLQIINTANPGLRFFTVYGPCLSREMRSKFQREGRPDMALFLFTKAILAGQPINVFNNGNMPVPWNAKLIPPGVRDFTYIDDIVEGVTRVIDNAPKNKDKSALSPHLGGDVRRLSGFRRIRPVGGWQRGYWFLPRGILLQTLFGIRISLHQTNFAARLCEGAQRPRQT
jgi:hypothetical protein